MLNGGGALSVPLLHTILRGEDFLNVRQFHDSVYVLSAPTATICLCRLQSST
jgi:hypothetical protein